MPVTIEDAIGEQKAVNATLRIAKGCKKNMIGESTERTLSIKKHTLPFSVAVCTAAVLYTCYSL